MANDNARAAHSTRYNHSLKHAMRHDACQYVEHGAFTVANNKYDKIAKPDTYRHTTSADTGHDAE